MYELTFTNVRNNTDLVGTCSEAALISIIMDQLKSGLFLTGIRKLDQD